LRGDNKAFIATQAPLKETIDDFWAMCMSEKVEIIVMLCKFISAGRVILNENEFIIN